MAKAKELQAWREKHFSQLEATLQVLKGIRDDPEATNKDRIEASKSIGRLLSAMSPSKATAKKQEGKKEQKPTQQEWDLIEQRLSS